MRHIPKHEVNVKRALVAVPGALIFGGLFGLFSSPQSSSANRYNDASDCAAATKGLVENAGTLQEGFYRSVVSQACAKEADVLQVLNSPSHKLGELSPAKQVDNEAEEVRRSANDDYIALRWAYIFRGVLAGGVVAAVGLSIAEVREARADAQPEPEPQPVQPADYVRASEFN